MGNSMKVGVPPISVDDDLFAIPGRNQGGSVKDLEMPVNVHAS